MISPETLSAAGTPPSVCSTNDSPSGLEQGFVFVVDLLPQHD